ncbi:hypothetical protein [Candidatus Nitrospira nitrificans]|uniref:hypothetical protein n=1 Tax=Candidatus Nitrospira nitrificans TaxID=1742973 RepID=UPI001112A54D|nr:hypothetical protein [Candidatus Nitrospira nitrificans]
MAHRVNSSIPQREIGRADIEFCVRKDSRVIGKLLVSKGAVVWRKKWKSTRGKKLGWDLFDQIMQKYGRSER